jgi:hypothetical protein
MKRIVAGVTLVALAGMLVAAPPAFAGGRRYSHHGGHGHHHHNGAGYLVGGLVLGALTGVVLGSIAAAPQPVYAQPPVVYQPAPAPVVVQPAPVYIAPPPPVCTDYYVPASYRNGVWVGAHWERICQ